MGHTIAPARVPLTAAVIPWVIFCLTEANVALKLVCYRAQEVGGNNDTESKIIKPVPLGSAGQRAQRTCPGTKTA